jgi:hypothetical protein
MIRRTPGSSEDGTCPGFTNTILSSSSSSRFVLLAFLLLLLSTHQIFMANQATITHCQGVVDIMEVLNQPQTTTNSSSSAVTEEEQERTTKAAISQEVLDLKKEIQELKLKLSQSSPAKDETATTKTTVSINQGAENKPKSNYNILEEPWVKVRSDKFDSFYLPGQSGGRLKAPADKEGPVLDFVVAGWPKV